MPAWSPDGQSIAYVTWTHTGGHIKRVAAAGGQPDTLTRFEGYYLDPAYTPDGSRIVFLSGAAADQLYSILLDVPPPGDLDLRCPKKRPPERSQLGPMNVPPPFTSRRGACWIDMKRAVSVR